MTSSPFGALDLYADSAKKRPRSRGSGSDKDESNRDGSDVMDEVEENQDVEDEKEMEERYRPKAKTTHCKAKKEMSKYIDRLNVREVPTNEKERKETQRDRNRLTDKCEREERKR